MLLLVMPFQAFAAARFIACDEATHPHEAAELSAPGHHDTGVAAMHEAQLRGAAHHAGHHAPGADRTCGCSACWPPIASSVVLIVPVSAVGSQAIAFAPPHVHAVVPGVLERPPRLLA
jgi:hypothetical protein